MRGAETNISIFVAPLMVVAKSGAPSFDLKLAGAGRAMLRRGEGCTAGYALYFALANGAQSLSPARGALVSGCLFGRTRACARASIPGVFGRVALSGRCLLAADAVYADTRGHVRVSGLYSRRALMLPNAGWCFAVPNRAGPQTRPRLTILLDLRTPTYADRTSLPLALGMIVQDTSWRLSGPRRRRSNDRSRLGDQVVKISEGKGWDQRTETAGGDQPPLSEPAPCREKPFAITLLSILFVWGMAIAAMIQF